MEKINLFECFITRKASIRFKTLINGYNEKINNAFGLIEKLDVKLDATINKLCNYLFEEVKRNDKERMNLIALKRKIYNKKPIESDLLERFKENSFLFENLKDYNQSRLEIQINKELILNIEQKFKTQFSSRMLCEANRKSFKKAVMLSSFSLYRNLTAIDNLKDKKRKDLENGVLKYFLRASSKTSPFSYFTTVELNEFNSKINTCSENSFTKVNVNILKYLLSLINKDNKIRTLLPLKLNRTIHDYKNNLIFLEFHKEQAIINKIKKTEFLDIIISFFESKNRVTYKDLRKLMINNYSIDNETFDKLFINLFNAKFLMLDLEVSIYQNWIFLLEFKLGKYKNRSELICKIIELLKVLSKLENRFPKASLKLRETLLVDSFCKLISFCLEFDDSIDKVEVKNNKINIFETYKFGDFKFRIENLIFEDIIGKGNTSVEQKLLEVACNDLNEIVKIITMVNKNKDIKLNNIRKIMRREFDNQPTNILPLFYEYQRKYGGSVFKNKLINSNKMLNKFNININQTEVKINLKKTTINEEYSIDNTSYNAYFQICEDKVTHKRLVVVNGLYPGYGKMFSRFLNKQDVDNINKFRNFNSINKSFILCENHENSYFNGNIHPMLADIEIKNYDGNNSISDDKIKNLSQLKIGLNNNQLEVVDDQNRRIFFVDLGFQITSLHSDFFKFLDNFTPNIKENYSPLIKAINKSTFLNNSSVKYFPRILYKENLVLQRMFWIIDKDNVSYLLSLPQSEIFIEINIWRKKLKIPSMVYVTLNYHEGLLEEYKNDRHKPFFVDFYNSTLINYLTKQISDKVLSIKISEMLPNYNKDNNVREFLVQWKNY